MASLRGEVNFFEKFWAARTRSCRRGLEWGRPKLGNTLAMAAMADERNPASFRTTRWELVSRARSVDADVRRNALDELVRHYRPALEAHLKTACGLDPEEAEEIVQGFLVKKILERELLAAADPQKGRLRALMLKALTNYLFDVRSKKKPEKLPLDESWQQPADRAQPADVFDVVWARTVLLESLRRMCEECRQRKRTQTWSLFELRVAAPILTGAPPMDYAELVQRFGFASPAQASNALVTAVRQFRRVLHTVVEEYATDEQIEPELIDLHNILAAVGPLGTISSWRPGLPCGALSQIAPPADAVDSSAVESTRSHWSSLFDPEPQSDKLWTAAELQVLLDQQLSQPLSEIFSELDEVSRPQLPPVQAANDSSAAPLVTLLDLFTHPAPPLDVLEAVKRWARRATRDDASSLPLKVSSLIYFATIAAGLVQLDKRITKSDNQTLRFGLEHALSEPCKNLTLSTLIDKAKQIVGQ